MMEETLYRLIGNRPLIITAAQSRLKTNYKKGFKFLSETKILALRGRLDIDDIPATKLPADIKIVNYFLNFLDVLTGYDATIHTVGNRGRLLKSCFDSPEVICRIAIHDSGAVVGYGAFLPVNSGWRLEPLYADSQEIALSILTDLMTSLPVEKPMIFLQTPDSNDNMVNVVRELKFESWWGGDYVYRMSNAPMEDFESKIPMKKVYAVFGTESALI
jgi:hypothetical protein